MKTAEGRVLLLMNYKMNSMYAEKILTLSRVYAILLSQQMIEVATGELAPVTMNISSAFLLLRASIR